MSDSDQTRQTPDPSLLETLAGAEAAKAPLPEASPGPHRVLVKAKRLEPEFPVADWDRYAFVSFLGQGGMGKVFLARDKRLGREVALKFVRSDDARFVSRFLGEARAQARVDHPHVCKVFEAGEVEGRAFIAMQPIKGLPFDSASLTMSLEQKVVVLRDAALGVHEAHRMGIIHRDLKPSNILVAQDEDGADHAYVMDFGLAHEWDAAATETGSVLGTPAFMSPEQARGEVTSLDRRSDVYSLGATLYQVLTGHTPVEGDNPLEILSAVSSADPRPLRALRLDIPKDLEAITLKCLEKDRTRRYDSAKALAEDLDRFLAGDPVHARSTGLGYRLMKKVRKHKQLTAVGAAATLIVLSAGGMAIKARRDAGHRETLARRFTEAMGRIESLSRYSALAPPHDIRPDLKAIREQMAQLELEMRRSGRLADGPGHYALGWGHWTLDDPEQAREHLQMAWDAGYREPKVAYALAVVLGHDYRERLLEAERITNASAREARKREIEGALRTPALAYLRRAQSADNPSPAYLEALLAFYEGRLDDALARLQTLGREHPWFYEAPLLRGSLLQARAWKQWNQGARTEALADFEAGREALRLAGAVGRSAPMVHVALAELEFNALFMEKYGEGRVEPAYARGLEAVEKALAAHPDHVPALILKSALMRACAGYRTDRGEPADDLVQGAVDAAREAVAAGPRRADARSALGLAYYQWGKARQDRDLDPTEPLSHALEAFGALSPEKRDYTVENHLGLVHQTWVDWDEQHGRDPVPHLGEAIAAYRRATAMAPQLLPAWINLGTCLHRRGTLPGAAAPEADLKAAQEVLERAHALNPKHFVPCFMLGRVHFAVGLRRLAEGADPRPELELALAAHREGLAINPKVPHLLNGEALALIELARAEWERGGDPALREQEARQAAQGAIQVAPGQVYGYRVLTELLLWRAHRQGIASARPALAEAGTLVRKALALLPNDKESLILAGRFHATRLEVGGAEVATDAEREGEAALAKALAMDPKDPEALSTLGELRATAARMQALRVTPEPPDFDRAAAALRVATAVSPDPDRSLLNLAHLGLAQATWERARGRDAEPGLALGRSALLDLRKHRPSWSEARALQAALDLEDAERLPEPARAARAQEALRGFQEARALNRNLAEVWRARETRAQRLGRG